MTPVGSPASAGPPLDEATVRARVRAGVALMAVRGGLLKLANLVGIFVLAHMLAPRDLGVIAIGLSIIALGRVIGDAGLGSAFLRRTEAPSRSELAALSSLQLMVAFAIAAAVGGVAWIARSETVAVAALMAGSLPLQAFRTPGSILLERELRYRPQVAVEVGEVLAYNACAITAVALGAGVWGVAAAVYAQVLTSVGVMWFVSPVGLVAPSSQLRLLSGTLRFGIAFQAANFITFTRELVVPVGIASIAGVATLGLWTIAFRLLSLPYLLFQSLWRVSFPGMARYLATGADPRPVIERSVGLSATATGLLLAGIVGTCPALIPAILGDEWRGATAAIPWACLGLMVTSISTAVAGFLYAKGDVGTVLRTTIYQAVAIPVIGLGLLPWLGLTAIGLGWLVALLLDGVVITRGVKRFIDVDPVRPILAPFAAALVSAGAAWWAAHAVPSTILNGIVLGAAVVVTYLGIHLLLAREQLMDAVRLMRRRAKPPAMAEL